MPLETVTTIADLNADWPLESDEKRFGDDHIRNIKKALKASLTEITVLPKTDDTGELRLLELAANGTNYVSLRAAEALDSSLTWTLPTTGGAPGTVLTNAGDGTLSWVVPAAAPAAAVIMPYQAVVPLVTGDGMYLFFGNGTDWNMRLLRISSIASSGAAPFTFNVWKDSSLGDPSVMIASGIMSTNIPTPGAYIATEHQLLRTQDYLRIEYTTGAGRAFIVLVAYERYV